VLGGRRHQYGPGRDRGPRICAGHRSCTWRRTDQSVMCGNCNTGMHARRASIGGYTRGSLGRADHILQCS
jgi:hypothetical protein